MTWIEGSRWDLDRGAGLTSLLANEYPLPNQTLAVLATLGVDKAIYPDLPTAGLRWFQLAQTLHERGELRKLTDYLAQQRPALVPRLRELITDPPEEMDGNPADAYEVYLLSGKRPLIDRSELRRALRDFLDESMPLFIIRGKPQTGKTYGLELVRHVTSRRPNLTLFDVDFASPVNGDDAAALIAKICRRVDVEEVLDTNNPTTRTRKAIELVDIFIGRYNNKYPDNRKRLLVIDGLNRDGLQTDVGEATAHLAAEVIRGNLRSSQLVLTGYAAPLDPDLDYGYVTEDVRAITETDVRFFFEHLVLPQKLSKQKVNKLVRDARVGQGDLKSLRDRVRSLSRDLLGTP